MDVVTHRQPLPRLLVIVSLGFAITVLVNTLEPAVLGHRVLELVPQRANTAMGLTTFAGLLVATLTQPIVGYLSDRTHSRYGRRLPYFVVGTLLVLVALYALATASAFAVVFAAVLLLQLGSNTVQGPWQALIPDLVPQTQRGQAAGLKAVLDIVGLMAGRQAAGQLIARAPEWGATATLAAVAVPAAALVVALLLTGLTLHDAPAATPEHNNGLRQALTGAFIVDWRRYPAFGWWFLHRLAFWGAFILLNTFLLFYLIDVVGLVQADAQRFLARLFTVLGGALVVITIPSGWVVDRLGRKPVVLASSVIAGTGSIVLLIARSLPWLTVAAAIIGLGIGMFMTASWALVTDIVPRDQAARYLGIANMAAAGGSGIARLAGGALIDPLNRLLPIRGGGYLVAFGLAAAAFWLSAVAAWRLPAARSAQPD